jgi:chromosomal replication initiator protein
MEASNMLANPDQGQWSQLYRGLVARLGERETERWFGASLLVHADREKVQIGFHLPMWRLYAESKLAGAAREAVSEIWGSGARVEMIDLPASAASRGQMGGGRVTLGRAEEAGRGELVVEPAQGQLALGDVGVGNGADPAILGRARRAGLNTRFTMENFVVGPNSQFAYAAAKAILENPGQIYSPFFIYGRPGLGKTHLLQAIGRAYLESSPRLRVMYQTSETFTNDFIDSIQGGRSGAKFRERYRGVDVLLIDDVQFFGGKVSTQEEFFHTFNELVNAEKQIVLASDRPPGELERLEERLSTRFQCGLTAELGVPDMETRLRILRRKHQQLGANLDSEVLAFLAERITLNVRRLEGALVRVASLSSLMRGGIGVGDLEGALSDLLREEEVGQVGIDGIQKMVAQGFDVRLSDMTNRRRTKEIALARQVAMFLCRSLVKKVTLKEIGEAFGGRDHGTVIHACKKVTEDMRKDPALRRKVEELERRLRGG